MITINMDKARDIHREAMRQVRDPLFKDLDVAYMVAIEQGLDASAIVAKKQELRDVTADPAIAAAQTPEQLKAVWPSVLSPT
jgi:hypothetical protein